MGVTYVVIAIRRRASAGAVLDLKFHTGYKYIYSKPLRPYQTEDVIHTCKSVIIVAFYLLYLIIYHFGCQTARRRDKTRRCTKLQILNIVAKSFF